jgi:hypothetical protein
MIIFENNPLPGLFFARGSTVHSYFSLGKHYSGQHRSAKSWVHMAPCEGFLRLAQSLRLDWGSPSESFDGRFQLWRESGQVQESTPAVAQRRQ